MHKIYLANVAIRTLKTSISPKESVIFICVEDLIKAIENMVSHYKNSEPETAVNYAAFGDALRTQFLGYDIKEIRKSRGFHDSGPDCRHHRLN